MPELNVWALGPAILLTAWGLLLLAAELVLRGRDRPLALLTGLGFLLALAWSGAQLGELRPGGSPAFGGMVVLDGLTVAWNLIFLLGGLLVLLFAPEFMRRLGAARPELYPLVTFATVGMMLMGASADLIVIFLGLELLSVSLYVLTALAYHQLASKEAGLKYLLLGAFSSAFLLYGVALVYGASGSTRLAPLGGVGGRELDPLALAGLALVLVGLAFKVSAVPFHLWTPDVYQGAPTPVTALMSVGAKAAGFAALLRVLVLGFPGLAEQWVLPVAVLAALTMVVGNLVALVQENVKRLLAYSSIAHAGYILVGVAAFQPAAGAGPLPGGLAVSGVLFYLLAYTFTNLGAFAVVASVADREGEHLEISEWAGLAGRRPLLAAAMTLFLVSLTGLPPTGGFLGKFYLFSAAVQAGLAWLAVVGVITSVVSAYFYLRIVVVMFMREREEPLAAATTAAGSWAVALCGLGTLLTGVLPGPLVQWLQRALG